MKTNYSLIGLDIEKSKGLVQDLNQLLANYQLLYINTRGFHWNIKGEKFFELHLKFEELYNDSQIKIDLIAERVLTLGGTPLHTFSDYIEHSKLQIGKNISNDVEAIQLILESLSILLQLERVILNKAAEINDEGTNSMMSDFIAEQEKNNWMLKAWMEEEI